MGKGVVEMPSLIIEGMPLNRDTGFPHPLLGREGGLYLSEIWG